MAKKAQLNQFNLLLAEIAEALIDLIATELRKGQKWASACLDARAPSEGSPVSGKFRVQLAKGKIKGIAMPGELFGGVIMDAFELKNKAFPEKWYGLKLTIYPTGECETEFNYNPNCVNDPTWYDS